MANPRDTVDTFIAEIPAGKDRRILVYRRRHGGREFIRWRYWHRHRRLRKWYPDRRRAFVIPLKLARPLVEALQRAVASRPEAMPAWVNDVEERQARMTALLTELKAPACVREEFRRKRLRAVGE